MVSPENAQSPQVHQESISEPEQNEGRLAIDHSQNKVNFINLMRLKVALGVHVDSKPNMDEHEDEDTNLQNGTSLKLHQRDMTKFERQQSKIYIQREKDLRFALYLVQITNFYY